MDGPDVTATIKAPRIPHTLYHYTCTDHGERGIRNAGVLRPNKHFLLDRPVVWLTDLDEPDPWVLGLTRKVLCCDRTAVRCAVDTNHPAINLGDIEPWTTYARYMPRTAREILEDVGMPMHWYVTEKPLVVSEITARGNA